MDAEKTTKDKVLDLVFTEHVYNEIYNDLCGGSKYWRVSEFTLASRVYAKLAEISNSNNFKDNLYLANCIAKYWASSDERYDDTWIEERINEIIK